jgi:hypothetical protein
MANPKKGPIRIILLGCAAIALSGCGFPEISATQRNNLLGQAKDNGVIIYFNGAFSDENRKMTRDLAGELGMAHLPGRKDVLDILRRGENSTYGNHLIYHSLGSEDAYDIANWCNENRIEIRGAHSLDAFGTHTFPSNVERVTNYFSEAPYPFKNTSQGGQEVTFFPNIRGSDHLNLPWKVKPLIKKEIQNRMSRRDVQMQRIPRRSGR